MIAANPVLETLITRYCAAWSTGDWRDRAHLLQAVWTDEGVYLDPSAHVEGRAALVAHIGEHLLRHPGTIVVPTSMPEVHHGVMCFAWALQGADGANVREGIHVGEMAPDGRLQRVVGFFSRLAQPHGDALAANQAFV